MCVERAPCIIQCNNFQTHFDRFVVDGELNLSLDESNFQVLLRIIHSLNEFGHAI